MTYSTVYPGALDPDADLPHTIDSDTNRGSGAGANDGTKGWESTLLNRITSAIKAVQTELGLNPSASFVDVATRLNQMTSVRKTATQNMAGTTAVNITDLAFPIPATAGVFYTMNFEVAWTSTTATAGFGISHTFPTLGTNGWCSSQVLIGALTSDGAGELFSGQLTGATGADVVMSTAAVATGTIYIATVHTILYAGTTAPTAGTYQLQGRSETTAGAINVREGSHGILYTG